jgi:hypothetical protein
MHRVEERFRMLDNYMDYEPTLVVDMTNVSYKSNTHHEAIFDLQGRRLQGKPERGVYIRNGQKYLR